MSFQRARSDKQIQKRIDEIVLAASKIYDENGYDGLSFSAISELTKFTRPTIYKYFSTKEEILLYILSDDIGTWANNLISSFKLNKIYSTHEISKIWAKSLSSQKRINELYSILFTILEKNSSIETLASFKETAHTYIKPLYELVGQLFPNITSTQIDNFMTLQYSLAIGLYPMCNLSKIQLEAIKIVNLSYISPNFEDTYQKALFQLMYCLENGIEL